MEKLYIAVCLFFVIYVFPTGECGNVPCPIMQQLHCYPTTNMQSCVNFHYNQTGTWIDSQRLCASNGGRLVWFGNQFGIHHLQSTLSHFPNHSMVRLGLMVSTDGNDDLLWKMPTPESNFVCGSSKTKLCSSTNSSLECTELGCCMKNGRCAYPDSQVLVNNTASVDDIHIPGSSSDTTRRCVIITHDWKLQAIDCLQDGDELTVAPCEYKCHTDWPVTLTYNVTSGNPVNGTTNSGTTNNGIAGTTSNNTTGKTNGTTGAPSNNTTVGTSPIQSGGNGGGTLILGGSSLNLNLLLSFKLMLVNASITVV